MAFERDSLKTILERTYANYAGLFQPLDNTPRCNLLKVFSAVDAGIYHQLLGDLDFLAQQIFPDTATGDNLREHWSARVPPLHAAAARGKIIITGKPNLPVSAGLVFASGASERYFTEKQYRLNADGIAAADVRSEGFGFKANLQPGAELKIISAIPAGMDSAAKVTEAGISGGADSETDEEYLSRVLLSLRNPAPYGKPGDFAQWAKDYGTEISAAWEYANYGVFGVLLIQVINGNQFDGAHPVSNLNDVANYIKRRAPLVPFTVRNPEIITLNPAVALPPQEDTLANRGFAEKQMRSYLQINAKPGYHASAASLRGAIVDGITITDAVVKLSGNPAGTAPTTILQYPYIGEVTWE